MACRSLLISMDFLDHLPPELVLKVLSYLQVKDSLRCRSVSRRWRQILDHLDRYWLKACEQIGVSIQVVEKYSSRVGLPNLVLAGVRHRHWVAARRPTVGKFQASARADHDRRCDVHRLGLLRGTLGVTNATSCLIGNGYVLCIDSVLKPETCLVVKKVCPESKTLVAINLLESFPAQRGTWVVIWAKATADYILLLTASGMWFGFCLLTKKVVLEWRSPRKSTTAQGSYLHVLCCNRCFIVVTASSFRTDSPIWELLVIRLGKGSTKPNVVMQRTLLVRLQPKENIIQWYLYPTSSQSCDEDNFCLSHKLVCHSDVNITVFTLEHTQPELKAIVKSSEVHIPVCQCFVLDGSTRLPVVSTTCLSADYQLLGTLVDPYHLFIWDTLSWQIRASVDLEWVDRLGTRESVRLLAVGHLYSVIAVTAASRRVSIHVFATPTGVVINEIGQLLSSRAPLAGGLLDLGFVNEDWLNNIHCFNAPFLIFLAPSAHRYSLISFIQFQNAPRSKFKLFTS